MIKLKKITKVSNLLKEEIVVATKLFKLRLLSGMDRFELAKMTGIDELLIANYENALIPIPASELYILAMALGFNVEHIYAEQDIYYCENTHRLSAVN